MSVLEKRFNPCFNGTMYKNPDMTEDEAIEYYVSILVLMELCIKTKKRMYALLHICKFQSLF